MNLYEINYEIEACVDAETGEIIDIDRLVELQMAREQKLEGVACWIKNLTAEVKSMKEEEARLADRRKVKERKAESLKRYLSEALNGEKFETAKCAVSFRKNPGKVEVYDTQAAVAWLEENGLGDLVTRPKPEISRKEVGAMLKEGTEVPGCVLMVGMSMSVK